MRTIAGWAAKQTTALAYRTGPPDDLEDAYVMKDGRLQEVWDCAVEIVDGNVILFGSWPEDYVVGPDTPIFYSPPERWA